MKLYRGVDEKTCKGYKKHGIKENTNFSTSLKVAKHWGKCIIEVNKTSNFKEDKDNYVYKDLKILDKTYLNKKPIKRFKIK